MQPLIVDAHEDLAWNMVAFGRDYTRAAAQTRELERGSDTVVRNGETLLGWDDYQRGRVALVFGTLFAPPYRESLPWENGAYKNADEAHELYSAQLDRYHRLTETHPDKFQLVTDQQALSAVLLDWQDDAKEGHPVGIVPLMEGADGIRSPQELPAWWQRGLRIIGLAWTATRYSGGTHAPGPLTPAGYELLAAMQDFPFILDISHMDPLAARQALDVYEGPVIASHANVQALLPGLETNRHLPDDVIRSMIARDGVIGSVVFNRFLKAGWQRGDSRDEVTLETLVNHMDYICQIAGSARHVGLGSDFDGGFGLDAAPSGIETIADLQKLTDVLAARGYSDDDITAIMGGNWMRILQQHLPERAA